jgi:SacI homology domain
MYTSIWTPCKSAASAYISSDTDISVLAQAIVNLAEQSSKEGPITQAFREYAQELNEKDVAYVFHVSVVDLLF